MSESLDKLNAAADAVVAKLAEPAPPPVVVHDGTPDAELDKVTAKLQAALTAVAAPPVDPAAVS